MTSMINKNTLLLKHRNIYSLLKLSGRNKETAQHNFPHQFKAQGLIFLFGLNRIQFFYAKRKLLVCDKQTAIKTRQLQKTGLFTSSLSQKSTPQKNIKKEKKYLGIYNSTQQFSSKNISLSVFHCYL